MTSSGSAAEPHLTRKQREWLRHLRACHRPGIRVKDYAAKHGIPVQSLYQAAKRLRQRGVLAPSGRRASVPPGFVKVAVEAAPTDLRSAWRIRLPSGAVFESTTPLSGDALLAIVERLAQAR
jgi:transposase-like protein